MIERSSERSLERLLFDRSIERSIERSRPWIIHDAKARSNTRHNTLPYFSPNYAGIIRKGLHPALAMEESEDNGNRYDVEGEGEIEVPNIRLKKRCLPSNLCWKTLLWSGFAMAYLLFGGLIFTLAERPNELDRIDTAQMEREEARRQLELLINQTIATIVNFTNGTVNETQATALVEGVANVSAVFALTFLKLQRETSPLWTYSSAVFFASTVITTIGKGNRF